MLTVVQASTQASALEVSRVALVATLDRARHVVPTRFPKPILACVRLEAVDNWLRISATDGELALFTQMPVEGELPACVVPFAELSRRLKASKQATCALSLSANGEQFLINGGRVAHTLHTLPVDDFPPVNDAYVGETVSIDAAELVGALRIANLAVAKETSRYAIDGVVLESDQKGTRLVATDGRRLVVGGLARGRVRISPAASSCPGVSCASSRSSRKSPPTTSCSRLPGRRRRRARRSRATCSPRGLTGSCPRTSPKAASRSTKT
jgi:DNA polymerase-3 subunit beta